MHRAFRHPFGARSIQAAWVVTLSVAYASAWAASAGRVDSADGKINVLRASGETVLQSGSEVREGDTLITGSDGWALISMADGGIITLRPDTRLQVETYRYSGGARNDDSVLLNLLRGTFRSVTGEVGHFAHASYRVKTPTATIGIRGTDHEPAYFPPGESADHEPGTFDRVTQGESFIQNGQGQVQVKAGQSAFVHHDGRSAPRVLDRAPGFYARHAALDQRIERRHRALEDLRRQRFERRIERRDHERPGSAGRPGQQGNPRGSFPRGQTLHPFEQRSATRAWREEHPPGHRWQAQEWQQRNGERPPGHAHGNFHPHRR